MASPFQPLPQRIAEDKQEPNSLEDNSTRVRPKLFDTAPRKKRILHVEFDRTLLAVRHALLESAGFEVISCFSGLATREVSTATAPFDLFLIGHAAPVAERNELVAWMKSNFPRTTVVVLRPRETDSSPIGDVTTTVEPADLVKAIVDALKCG